MSPCRYDRQRMIRGLAIETSGRTGSIALAREGAVMEEQSFEHGLQNAAKILPTIDTLCASQGWKPKDLDEVYVSLGPGSFTGLRLAVTIAKTLALATGVRIVGVPSMPVLAQNAPPDAKHLIIVLDAKRGQIYTARFERSGDEMREVEPAHLDRLKDVLARSPRPVHLLGEGIDYHRDAFDANDARIVVTAPSRWIARASVVAEIGHAMARGGRFSDPDRLTPIYIRLAEAEEKWLAQQEAPQDGNA